MITTNTYWEEAELIPKHDTKKSFYGKARIIKTVNSKEEQILTLLSYNTQVAYVNLPQHKACVTGTYSTTTLRHIKEFLKQNGFKAENKTQILKDYSHI